jgi:hypothetical protein
MIPKISINQNKTPKYEQMREESQSNSWKDRENIRSYKHESHQGTENLGKIMSKDQLKSSIPEHIEKMAKRSNRLNNGKNNQSRSYFRPRPCLSLNFNNFRRDSKWAN